MHSRDLIKERLALDEVITIIPEVVRDVVVDAYEKIQPSNEMQDPVREVNRLQQEFLKAVQAAVTKNPEEKFPAVNFEMRLRQMIKRSLRYLEEEKQIMAIIRDLVDSIAAIRSTKNK